jgi:flagellar hook-length control protein FliK
VTSTPGPVPVGSPLAGSAAAVTESATPISGPSAPNAGGVPPVAVAPADAPNAAAPHVPATVVPATALSQAGAGRGTRVAPDGAKPAAAKSQPTIPGQWVQPGVVTLTPTSTVTAAAHVAAPQPASSTPAPLNTQLAPALFQLRDVGAGIHVLTLTVAPEAVGPVTVRARVEASGIRIELSAPT